MTNFLNAFLKDEDGAVSIDWVVLTAAIVAMGVAAGGAISTASDGITGKITTYANSVSVS